jgi:NNP family nitrate/nitrite transporter-like MFS transporter
MKSAFFKAGRLATLIACFLYFDLSFAVWVILGPLAVLIAPELDLDAGQKGLMVATPILAGAVFQLVPQRFGRDVGLTTGLAGMTGGVGGFYLAASLGHAKQFVGSYGLGFTVFAILALAARYRPACWRAHLRMQ